MQRASLGFLVCFALGFGCGCAGADPSDGKSYFYPGSGQAVELEDGDYRWTVIDEARFGGGVGAVVALAADDVWFFGRDVRHWDGDRMERTPLTAAGIPGPHRDQERAQVYRAWLALAHALADIPVVCDESGAQGVCACPGEGAGSGG